MVSFEYPGYVVIHRNSDTQKTFLLLDCHRVLEEISKNTELMNVWISVLCFVRVFLCSKTTGRFIHVVIKNSH